jgi:hypothetical protein
MKLRKYTLNFHLKNFVTDRIYINNTRCANRVGIYVDDSSSAAELVVMGLKMVQQTLFRQEADCIFFKEVAQGGVRTWVLSISFIFSFFTTLLLSHIGSPTVPYITGE